MKQGKQPPKTSDLPIYLFRQGNNQQAYRYFGAHLCEQDGQAGAVFRVWAPHANAVAVVGDFNNWAPGDHPMQKVADGQATKIIIPSEMQGLVGLANGIVESAKK